MNPEITAYIDTINQKWQAEVCTHLRRLIHQALPEVEERMQYGKPHFSKNGRDACVLGVAKTWVNLTIFNARTLQAPDGFFEPGGSPDRKTIKIREGQDVDDDLVAKLVQQAAGL